MSKKSNKKIDPKASHYFKVLGLALLALIYFKFGVGAITLEFWVLAIASFLATVTLIIGGVKVSRKQPPSLVVFIGTLAVFIAHIPITIFGNDESPIFLIVLAIIPTIAGINLFLKTRN